MTEDEKAKLVDDLSDIEIFLIGQGLNNLARVICRAITIIDALQSEDVK